MDYQQQLLAAMAVQSQLSAAAYGNNPMAAYAAAAAAASSNPFAAFYGASNNATTVNGRATTANPFQFASNGFGGWPSGTGAADSYMMNVAAWQQQMAAVASGYNPGAASLLSPSSLFGTSMASGTAADATESFDDVLNRMPRAPTTTAGTASVSSSETIAHSSTTVTTPQSTTDASHQGTLSNGLFVSDGNKRDCSSAFHSVLPALKSDVADGERNGRVGSRSQTPVTALPLKKRPLETADSPDEEPSTKVSKSTCSTPRTPVAAKSESKKSSAKNRTSDSSKSTPDKNSAAAPTATATDQLSSNVQINPQLLQASQAMFNQVLLDLAQKEFLRQFQQQQFQTTAHGSTSQTAMNGGAKDEKQSPPKKRPLPTKQSLTTPVLQKSPSASSTSSGRGRPATISTSPIDFGALIEDNDHHCGDTDSPSMGENNHRGSSTLDEVIDSVVRQQKEMAAAEAIRSRLATTLPSSSTNRRKAHSAAAKSPADTADAVNSASPTTMVMTVREQLAMKRAKSKHSSSSRHSGGQLTAGSDDIPLDLSVRSDNMDSVDRVLEETIQKASQEYLNGAQKDDDGGKASQAEKLLRVPLAKGWRRETCISAINEDGIGGDVTYYTPSGRRLSSLAELVRHLSKYKVKDLNKNHFSFNPKLLLGEFMKVDSSSETNGIRKLNENELNVLLGQINSLDTVDKCSTQQLTSKTETDNDASSVTQNAAHHDKAGSHSKQLLKLWNANKEKEQTAKAQKYLETVREAAVKEQHAQMQQMALIQEQEQERIRQQLLAAQRQTSDGDERSAIGSSARDDEKNVTARQLMTRQQQRQPTEDLEVEQSKPLPQIERIAGLQLSGQAFADLLTVIEFVHTFGHVLNIQKKDLPSLDEVHAGLLNDAVHMKAVRRLTKVLVTLVVEYPGLPSGTPGRTFLGQSVKDVGVTRDNYSELMCMFLQSRDAQGKQLSELLSNRSFEGLSPDNKAAILAYMCNELLVCRNVVREIEGNIDDVARIKGEKWIKEGKLRLLRNLQASKRLEQSRRQPPVADTTTVDTATDPKVEIVDVNPEESCNAVLQPELDMTVKKEPNHPTTEGKQQPPKNEKSSDASFTPTSAEEEREQLNTATATLVKMKPAPPGSNQVETLTEEEKQMSADELEILINGNSKEIDEQRRRIEEISNRVRVQPLGVDRYQRFYWQLPKWNGALLVEGAESSTRNNPALNFVADIPTRWRHNAPRIDDGLLPPVDLDAEQCCFDVVNRVCSGDTSTTAPVRRRVPLDQQRGWWRIGDTATLDSLRNSMQSRGIRERLLSRLLAKCDLSSTANSDYPCYEGLSETKDCSNEAAMNVETFRRVVRQVCLFEEKVLHANVHNRLWKPLSHADVATTTDPSQLHSTAHVVADHGLSPISTASSTDEDSSKSSWDCANDKSSVSRSDGELKQLKDRLLAIERNIERRYLRHPFNPSQSVMPEAILGSCSQPGTPTTNPSTPQLLLPEIVTPIDGHNSTDLNPVPPIASPSAVTQQLSAAVAECSAVTAVTEASLSEPPSEELLRWRSGVEQSQTAARLMLALQQLDKNVAWEKSIMRASCQLCHSGENESQLLLCDGCDMGYHTYCFKPKMDVIPDGDWYCPACITRVSDQPCCLLCCRQESTDNDTVISCVQCENAFHIQCLSIAATLQQLDAKLWKCQRCMSKPNRAVTESLSVPNGTIDSKISTVLVNGSKSSPTVKTSKAKSAAKSQRTVNNLPKPVTAIRKDPRRRTANTSLPFPECARKILTELYAHKDSWPFKAPVDIKAFPLYKKVIRKPMDLSSIKTKLAQQKYESASQFIQEVRLVFDNCRTFNEDDSPVGKAGRTALRFLNRRWKEVAAPAETPPVAKQTPLSAVAAPQSPAVVQ